jgi:hypothetical protein
MYFMAVTLLGLGGLVNRSSGGVGHDRHPSRNWRVNALAHETSPCLLQRKDDPVDWLP